MIIPTYSNSTNPLYRQDGGRRFRNYNVLDLIKTYSAHLFLSHSPTVFGYHSGNVGDLWEEVWIAKFFRFIFRNLYIEKFVELLLGAGACFR